MTARDRVTHFAARMRAVRWARIALAAGGGAAFATAVAWGAGAPTMFVIAAAVVAIVVAVTVGLVTGRSARITSESAALWVEERVPQLRYALVSAIEQTPPVETLERTVRSVPWEVEARAILWRALRSPAFVVALGAAAWSVAPFTRQASGSLGVRGAAAVLSGAPVALGELDVTVAPPSYARRAEAHFRAPSLVSALPGSRITVSGSDARTPLPIITRDSTTVNAQTVGSGWSATWSSGAARALIRASRGNETRLIAIEPLIDSSPVVTLKLPVRDTVLRSPTGSFSLTADVHDDIGIVMASFEYIISSGEGERFTFRSGTLGARSGGAGTLDLTLRSTLSLEALKLAPGDVVHLRATARDGNTISGPGLGGSDSRSIRIAREGEYDSVAVDPAPPAEAEKGVLSQRMLLNLTEALVKRSRAMSRTDVSAESQRIARDQNRLRRQVGDIIFARLGDAGAGEHAHGAAEDDDTNERLTPEQLLKAAEAATAVNGEALDFDHDETPVVAINRPLLEAYNAMWDAGRELGSGSPQRALPPMRAALAAIQRARSAERLYLRGAPPPVVVDLAKVRMQGKEHGSTNRRLLRTSLDAGRRAALERFARAIELLGRDAPVSSQAAPSPNAGIDSLLVLRLDVAERNADAAKALERAIEALRSGKDATDFLITARRVLDGTFTASSSLGAWIGAEGERR